MMRRILSSILLLYVCLATHPAVAQNEATLYFMNSLPQVTYVNPALTPRYKFSLGLPGSSIMMQYNNNGFSYNDFAKKQGDSVVADMNKLYKAMAKRNYIGNSVQADVFRLSMKVNARMYLTLNATAKVYDRIMIPKDLTGIFINGTAAYVNGTATLSPEVEALGYLETAIGSSYIVNRKLTVGGRFKMLKGVANVTTAKARLDLSLDEDYAITARADMNVKTSGINNLDQDDYEIEDQWKDFLKNNGFAFDVGATYKITDRLTVGLSLIDIGSIKWTNDTYGYWLDPATANYTFQGIDLERVLNDDEDYLEEEMDDVAENFEPQEGVIPSYKTALPSKIYASASYQLKKTLHVGVLFFGEKFQGRFAAGGSTSIHKEFGRRLSTSLSYTVTNRSFNNIGAGISLNFAPIQIYVVGDNLLRAPLALLADGELNPFVNSMHYFNLRAGINFVFGWDKTQEKQPHSMTKQ